MSETMVKSANVTMQKGAARADGELALSDSKLTFTPFNQQFGLGPYQMDLDSISGVEPIKGKGAGILPLTGDAIRINLASGELLEFILANPEQWLDVLQGTQA